MILDEKNYLEHYGILRKSGRYEWGSGNNVETRSKDFLTVVGDMRKQGLSDVEIAKGVGMSTTDLRNARTIANNQVKQARIDMAWKLHEKGLSNGAIAERMNLAGESSVRALLAPGERDKANVLQTTANMLKDQVAQKTYIDVGSGVEQHIGVAETKLKVVVSMLKDEGYEVHSVKVLQLGTGKETEMKVLCPPGTTQKDAWMNRDNIRQIIDFSDDGGRTFNGVTDPLIIHPDRVAVKYGPDGGKEADGVIFVRPGVKDVALGKSNYAQVRIAVGEGHYLKGMAMYKDDLPKGVDLLFNTNKLDTGNKLDAMKPINDKDPELPFNSIVRQIVDKDVNGKPHVSSAMNIVNEEGDWIGWSRSLATQILSKQSPRLAETQLNRTFQDRKKELDELSNLTNPTVKKKMLEEFADSTDSAAVHLKAASLPRSIWHAILPISSMPPTQIYAPNYIDGEKVVLIRYPHGGKFEIPELIVNNNHPESKRLLGSARDAVGIHHSVAEKLSGADFDGDTVLVIPNNSRKIKVDPSLDGLKNFDPRASYPKYDGMPKMTSSQKGQEMGSISNLITDMTIKGANTDELAQAIRHSMVVIDAENHHLNYKQSYIDNGIPKLKEKYQGRKNAGASTIISKASADIYLPNRKPRSSAKGGPIDKITGKKEFEPTNEINFRTGKPKLTKFERLAVTDNAHTLVSQPSGKRIELIYADHSNRLKAMANEARLEMIKTPRLKSSASSKKVYENEVKSLDAKLALAIRNRPLERQAQIFANAKVRAKRKSNPDMDDETYRKVKFKALEEARVRTSAQGKEAKIKITQSEWDAIQAGAISDSKLSDILKKADMEIVREFATPQVRVLMTSANTRRAKQMLSGGATRAQVAEQLGVSLSTLDRTLDEVV